MKLNRELMQKVAQGLMEGGVPPNMAAKGRELTARKLLDTTPKARTIEGPAYPFKQAVKAPIAPSLVEKKPNVNIAKDILTKNVKRMANPVENPLLIPSDIRAQLAGK